MLGFNIAYDPFPECERLGVWIIDPKNAHAARDPEQEDPLQLVPQGPPLGSLEIERIDILIFLGRVFSVLNGAIRALAEPLRMFPGIRVIGRALERDIECDLESLLLGFGDQSLEVFDGAQLRMNRSVAAFLGSNCPRAAH